MFNNKAYKRCIPVFGITILALLLFARDVAAINSTIDDNSSVGYTNFQFIQILLSSFKEIIFLIIGAILGVLFSFLLPLREWHEKIKISKRSKRIKERQLLLESNKIYEWLIKYYETRGNLNDLFDCKIGNFEIKIPFLTKKEWQYFKEIDSANDKIVQYSETSNQNFEINSALIEFRKELGQNLFNEPTLYLDRLEESLDSIIFQVKSCEYFQMVTQLASLEEETFRAIQKNIFTELPIRDQYFSSTLMAQKTIIKPYSIGCTAALAFKVSDSYEIIIQTRSHTTVTFGGTKAVIPNFGLSPIIGIQNDNNILPYNFIKEYCEELFNYEDLIMLMNGKKSNPYWFYELSEAKELLSMWEQKIFTLEFLGFGFDAMNGTCNIALLGIINDCEYANKIKQNIIVNWEVAERTMKLEPIEFIDYKSSILEKWLQEKKYQFGSAFTIKKTLNRLKTIQNERMKNS